MERAFETTYSQDYKHRLGNRSRALQRRMDADLPGSCFTPPLPCTVPVIVPDGNKRNIDFEEEVKQKDFSQCGANRFIKNLKKTHPNMYNEIEANRPWEERAGGSPLKSTYQLDYDHLPERLPCPSGSSLESNRWPDWKYFQRECNGIPPCSAATDPDGGPCSCQLCPEEPHEDSVRTPRYGCVYAISDIPKSYITSGHWPERDWERCEPRSTEYREKVGRLGGVVQRENIHDHRRCSSPRNCRHKFFL